MLKKVAALLCILGTASSIVWATVSYRLDEFESSGSKSNIGIITLKGNTYFKAGLSPDFQFGPLGLGLDINLYVPLKSGGSVPSELSWLSFRMISYDYDNIWGVKWGRLTNVQYGYGLLVDRYDSGSAGSPEFNTSKAGFEAYYNIDKFGFKAMTTATNVNALRVQYRASEDVIFGKPLIVGANFVKDSDGVFDATYPTQSIRSAQTAFSADVGIPIIPKTLSVYAEHAQLANHGTGTSAGIGGALSPEVSYKFEYRILAADFMPGYFNNYYEATAFNFANAPSKNIIGFLGYLGVSLLDNYIKMELMYENYQDIKPILSGALGWKKIGPTVGVINYTKTCDNPDGGYVDASILYENFPGLPFPGDAVIGVHRYYKTFGDFNKPETETFTIAVRPNLNKLLNIPFL